MERFIRYGLRIAYVLGAIGLVGAARDDRLIGSLVPAGLLFVVIGALIHTNHRGARDAADARVWSRFHSALLVAVGALWTFMGAFVVISEL